MRVVRRDSHESRKSLVSELVTLVGTDNELPVPTAWLFRVVRGMPSWCLAYQRLRNRGTHGSPLALLMAGWSLAYRW